MKPYGTKSDSGCHSEIPILIQQNILIICSSSPSLDLVQSLGESQWFFLADIIGTLTTGISRLSISVMQTKVDLQIVQCVHGVCALQSSSCVSIFYIL